ncbi:MAG: thymidylate synthase (FAD) [Candidatus Aminicenantes bacterium]|nr:thymidylate synthase (FAD) [Candidatus Aminicenantes bacterium]
MHVILAGYNVDSEVIEELKKNSPPREDVTPETLSASYARISRDPRPVNELRAVARAQVEKARRSNQNIIFKMGHHSVAEHAVFNFDIIGVSRLAVEEIEKFRLCSYTEKSQRYIALKDDLFIPKEIKSSGKQSVFVRTIKAQNSLYRKLYKKLRAYFFDKHKEAASNPKKHFMLEGWAKEDARYVMSLATRGQLGMTVNARNLEFLIRRFASQKLAELKELNQKIYALAKEVAPSIILFTEANDFDSKTYPEIGEKAQFYLGFSRKSKELVCLVDFTAEADAKLIASLLHTSSSLPYEECFRKAKNLSLEEKKEFLKSAFKYMEFYDTPLREFEYVNLTYDLIISASCYAQLKRHRMATLTAQNYDPELGVTVPPSIEAVGSKKEFMEIMEETSHVYSFLKKNMDQGAEYVLTNAHRRRVLLKVNARELYHISRLREDATAQWDIRRTAGAMSKLAKEVMPLTCLLIGGKDSYPEVYKDIFGKLPKLSPPEE